MNIFRREDLKIWSCWKAPGWGIRLKIRPDSAGYYDLSEKYGVEFLDMQKDSYETYDCQGMELKICDEAMKLDFLINVPVMKGHCQTKITCALKI